jgi:hypothetical protein
VLRIFDHFPKGLLDLEAPRLHQVLDGPALVHIEGQKKRPLYVSVLLHGNEVTGWETVQALFARHGEGALPRSISLFIGNVAAAKHGLRHLDGQPDYNRIWGQGNTPEHAMAAEVLKEMLPRDPIACIDIHNTSGTNPHHAAVHVLAPEHLALASHFGHFVVFTDQQEMLQTRAFGNFCPSVIIECGMPDRPGGVEHALAYLQSCLESDGVFEAHLHPGDIDLFQNVATVEVPEALRFGFEGNDLDLRLLPDLDQLNFNELPPGTAFGEVRPGSGARLRVTDAAGHDLGDRYFRVEDDRLVTAVPVMPSLVSTDARIIRQDCLCYLMERMTLPET